MCINLFKHKNGFKFLMVKEKYSDKDFYKLEENWGIYKYLGSLNNSLFIHQPGGLANMPWQKGNKEDENFKEQLKGLLKIIQKYGNKGENQELVEARKTTFDLIKDFYKKRS